MPTKICDGLAIYLLYSKKKLYLDYIISHCIYTDVQQNKMFLAYPNLYGSCGQSTITVSAIVLPPGTDRVKGLAQSQKKGIELPNVVRFLCFTAPHNPISLI